MSWAAPRTVPVGAVPAAEGGGGSCRVLRVWSRGGGGTHTSSAAEHGCMPTSVSVHGKHEHACAIGGFARLVEHSVAWALSAEPLQTAAQRKTALFLCCTLSLLCHKPAGTRSLA